MINEEKIKLMTRVAIYEKNTGKDDLRINEFYKNDYVLLNNIMTRVSITIAFLAIYATHAGYMFFNNLQNKVTVDYINLGKKYLIGYVVVLVIYSIISTYIYTKKYNQAQKRLLIYNKLLDKVYKYNEIEKEN